MKLRALGRSLTLRLALLYAVSTLFILLGVSWYMLRVVDEHFVEQDVTELRGKLELASRLLTHARDLGQLDQLPRQLDDALVGHHQLELALYADGALFYSHGDTPLPAELRARAGRSVADAPLVTWFQNGGPDHSHHHVDAGRDAQTPTHAGTGIGTHPGTELRGLALRFDAPAGGPAPGSGNGSGKAPGPSFVLAVAVDTAHHRAFIANFVLALWVVLALAGLIALGLGWAVARVGLTPLRQTAQLAREISAQRLSTRLSTERIPPELADLASSFNAMLDRLRDAIERLSVFATDLAHEMRTPVSNLMMQTQVMLGQARTADEYREVLVSNTEEYERLARTIADMLFLAKADNGLIVPTLERVDLARELAELVEFYEALAEDRGVRLVCSGAATVRGDRLMLRRAVSNLLSNALRYSARGAEVQLTLTQGASGATLKVANPCAPLAPAQLDRLFDRFYRAEGAQSASGDGAGLGLAITRSIARAHGGDVTVEGTADGVCFCLALPASVAMDGFFQ